VAVCGSGGGAYRGVAGNGSFCELVILGRSRWVRWWGMFSMGFGRGGGPCAVLWARGDGRCGRGGRLKHRREEKGKKCPGNSMCRKGGQWAENRTRGDAHVSRETTQLKGGKKEGDIEQNKKMGQR